MDDPAHVSVLLPTVRRTDAIEEVAGQLAHDDELLVICDAEDDPIAQDRERLPPGTRLVVAGEPEGCSGKANAIAAGMEATRHDRIVWTDDDFHHPPEWLATLRADYEAHGPVTELPHFVGRDPLSIALEPLYAVVGTTAVADGGVPWGGATCFDRADLDEDTFLADLRRTVSDDGLLGEALDGVTARKRTRTVPVGGSVRASLERHVRFAQLVRHHEPATTVLLLLALVVFAAGSVLFPLLGAGLATALVGATYARFGIRRWTAILAFPTFLAQLPLTVYALARRTFVWGGRRYRWHSKFDVEVVGEE